MAQQDVIDTPRLLLSFALGVSLTIALVFAVQALYLAGQEQETARKELTKPPTLITEVQGAQRDHLSTAKVVTKRNDGTPEKVEIPIDRAMDYVIKEQRGR